MPRHVAKGISTVDDRKGNHIADKCADIGIALHGVHGEELNMVSGVPGIRCSQCGQSNADLL